MRKNRIGLFHEMIIASICCILLVGCGYKADPYWVGDKPVEVPKDKVE